MTKLEQKLIELGYNCLNSNDRLYYKCFKCTIWIILSSDKNKIKGTNIDYKVLATTRADGILAEYQLQSDLKELKEYEN